MRISSAGTAALVVLAVIVLLMVAQFGPTLFGSIAPVHP